MRTVEVGLNDSPQRIAHRLTGDPRRYQELLAANPHKSLVYVHGIPTFASLGVGEPLGVPDGWLGDVPPIGSMPQSVEHLQANVQADASIPADAKAKLLTAASPDQVQATQTDALAGIQTIASGGTPTRSQIQAGLGVAAAGALSLASGMSLAAAMPVMLPIAAVLFATGIAIDTLIKGALGIATGSNWACDPHDKTVYGKDPSDPNWKHTYNKSLYDGWSGTAPVQDWAPATTGKFEAWARPILMLASDIAGNCHPVPGVEPTNPDTIKKAYETGSTVDWQKEAQLKFAKWQLGMIKAWNDVNPGAPMRTITQNLKLGMNDPKSFDPIQEMLWRFRRTLPEYASQLHSNTPISIQVADPAPKPSWAVVQAALQRAAAAAPPPAPKKIAFALPPTAPKPSVPAPQMPPATPNPPPLPTPGPQVDHQPPGPPAVIPPPGPPGAALRGAYEPYPPAHGALSAPPPHPHPGHHPGGGGHPHPGRGGGGGRRWWRGGWWDGPWLYDPITTTTTCATWGDPIEMSPAMQSVGQVQLRNSGGRPAAVRGGDGVLYLFANEGGALTMRPCAALSSMLGDAPLPGSSLLSWAPSLFYLYRKSGSGWTPVGDWVSNSGAQDQMTAILTASPTAQIGAYAWDGRNMVWKFF